MLTLQLGVVDIPYVAYEPPAKQRKRVSKHVHVKAKRSAGTVTTGDVAGFLEDKYHIMEVFFEENAKQIGEWLAEDVGGAIEDMMLGGPAAALNFGTTESNIDARFRDFLSNREMDSLGIPGVPTQAALDGVNHRLKSGRGKERPSFVDTGLYQNSFKAVVE